MGGIGMNINFINSIFNIVTNGVFFGCTPVFQLFVPLTSLVIVSWSVITILTYEEEKKFKILNLIGAVFAVFMSVAGAMFLVGWGIPVVAFYFIKMLTTIEEKIKKRYGKFSKVIYPIGFLITYALIAAFAGGTGKTIMGLIYLLKLAIAFGGLLFLRTYIRRTGMEPDGRKLNLKFQGVFLLIMVFILFLIKFNFLFNADINMYIGILMTRLDTFVLVFLLLLAGAIFFISQEKKMSINLQTSSILSPEQVNPDVPDGL
jgi:hypothetical protein